MLDALKLSKPIVILFAALALAAVAGLGFWRGMAVIDRIASKAAEGARKERDAHWTAEIAKSNAAVQKQRAEQAIQSAAADARASAEISRLKSDLATLESRNAALPNADACGLDRDRVRLLDANDEDVDGGDASDEPEALPSVSDRLIRSVSRAG